MTVLVTLDRDRPLLDGPMMVRLEKTGITSIDLPLALAAVDDMLGFARVRLAKARLPKTVRQRDALLAEAVPTFRAELADYFGRLLRRAGIRKADDLSIDVDAVDWDAEEVDLSDVMTGLYRKLGLAAYDATSTQLGVELSFDLEGPDTAPIRDAIATKVAGITERTRGVITSYVETAIERGYSIDDLVNGVDGDGFLGLGAIFADRAQTIALTETATAYNLAAVQSYRDSGLVDQVLIFDGPECGWTEHDDPDLADGSIRDLDDFEAYPTSHPNCQRAAGPVVSA